MQREFNLEVGTVPQRTCVELLLDAATGRACSKKYRCIDCGFTTFQLDEMQVHQDNQRDLHTFWQRFRRWSLHGRDAAASAFCSAVGIAAGIVVMSDPELVYRGLGAFSFFIGGANFAIALLKIREGRQAS